MLRPDKIAEPVEITVKEPVLRGLWVRLGQYFPKAFGRQPRPTSRLATPQLVDSLVGTAALIERSFSAVDEFLL